VKTTLLRVLSRAHLLRPTYRAWERARAAGHGNGDVVAGDGLPVPPPHLIVRVAGTPDAMWFLEGGRAARDAIDDALAVAGAEPRDVLDFGCGCGRVLRTWSRHDGEVAGSDLSGDAINWCRVNLPFARVETNGLTPPLAFDEASFDLAYALSVFTHLPAAMQHDWLDELHRVVRPGGHLLLTTHGERYLERLEPDEQAQFDAGELVVRWGEVPGTNLCTTFHPRSWVREELLPHGFEEVTFVPEGARGNPHQDLYLLRRSA
jgi:SAM-dependent methyltransferase